MQGRMSWAELCCGIGKPNPRTASKFRAASKQCRPCDVFISGFLLMRHGRSRQFDVCSDEQSQVHVEFGANFQLLDCVHGASG